MRQVERKRKNKIRKGNGEDETEMIVKERERKNKKRGKREETKKRMVARQISKRINKYKNINRYERYIKIKDK